MFIRFFGDLCPYVYCKKQIIHNSKLTKKIKIHAWHVTWQSFFRIVNYYIPIRWIPYVLLTEIMVDLLLFFRFLKFTQSNKYIIVSFTISFMHIMIICLYNILCIQFYLHPTNITIIKPLSKLFMPHCLYYWISIEF